MTKFTPYWMHLLSKGRRAEVHAKACIFASTADLCHASYARSHHGGKPLLT